MEMNLIEEFLHLSDSDEKFSKNIHQITKDIQDNKTTILALVESLGIFLSEKSPEKRAIGVTILSQIINNLPHFFNTEQLNFLCKYYCSRLKDHYQVLPPTFKGIEALSKCSNVPEGCATQIIKDLLNNISCQQEQPQNRLIIYKILKNLFENHRNEMLTMGLDYVRGVISFIDTESDATNLQFLFDWLPEFLGNVELNILKDEMFDVLSCYYPVDFKATPKNPTITREGLAKSLCKCLVATPDFSINTIDLALEKLDTNSKVAKNDSLQLLSEAFNHFNLNNPLFGVQEVWGAIYKAYLTSNEPETKQYAAVALKNLVANLDNPKKVLQDLMDSLKGNLSPDLKLFEPTITLLIALSEASPPASEYVINEASPLMTNLYKISTNIDHKIDLLEATSSLTQIYLNSTSQSQNESVNQLIILSLNAINDSNDRLQNVGFEVLGAMAPHLPLEIRNQLYIIMNNLMKENESFINCLKKFSLYYSEEIKQNVFEKNKVLNILIHLVDQDGFTDYVIENLLSCLETDLNSALRNVLEVLENTKQFEKVNRKLLEENFLSSVYSKLDTEVDFQTVLKVTDKLVNYQSIEEQKKIFNNCFGFVMKFLERGEKTFIYLLFGLTVSLKQEEEFNEDLIETLVSLTDSSDSEIKETAIILLANIINKTDLIEDKILAVIEKKTNSELDAWVCKSLMMKSSPNADRFLTKILQNLEHGSLLGIVMNENIWLSKYCYCKINPFYRQKFFIIASTRINSLQDNNHDSIGYLMENATDRIVLNEFPKIFRQIILCLDNSKNIPILLSILERLHRFALNKEELIEDHLGDFINRFLKLSSFQDSMKIRIVALKCLQVLALKVQRFRTLPYKSLVVEELKRILDDKKRLVRIEARQASSLWYLLDDNVEDS